MPRLNERVVHRTGYYQVVIETSSDGFVVTWGSGYSWYGPMQDFCREFRKAV